MKQTTKTLTSSKQRIVTLCECAILVALGSVLSVLKLYDAPLGGAVTLMSTVPIMLISLRHGLGWGFGSAFVFSVIQLITGLGSLSYVPTAAGIVCSVLFDYIVPFTLLGIAGIFVKDTYKSKTEEFVRIILGVLLAFVLRFLCHYFVGALLWYEITKAGEWNDLVFKHGMWVYSFIYNISYLGPDYAIALIATPVLPVIYRQRLTK